MAFINTLGPVETAEQEQIRLAEAPEGSRSHALSELPVQIHGHVQDLIIELPRSGHRVIVVPLTFRSSTAHDAATTQLPRQLYAGSWDAVVVASDHPSYPVGGYHIVVPTAELVRGRRIQL